MSFKVINNSDPNPKRETFRTYEVISTYADLDATVKVSRLKSNPDGSYFVWLPATHAVGQEKIVQLIDDTAGNSVYVFWNNAVDGNYYSYELYTMGDTLVLYSTPQGWHVFSRVDWY